MAQVGDPYSFQLPPPNQSVTIPGIVTQVDGSGNVLQAMPVDASTGSGSGGSGVSIYRADMAGTETHSLPPTDGVTNSFTNGIDSYPGDFTTPIQATVHVPSNGMLLVYMEREYSVLNVEDPTAKFSLHTALYHPTLFPYSPDDFVWPPRMLDSGDFVADGTSYRSLNRIATTTVDAAVSVALPAAHYNQDLWSGPGAFMVPGGDYTIAMKWDSSHRSTDSGIPTSGATVTMQNWTMTLVVLAP